jgi:hypothetical protein
MGILLKCFKRSNYNLLCEESKMKGFKISGVVKRQDKRIGIMPTYSQRDRTKYTRKTKHKSASDGTLI